LKIKSLTHKETYTHSNTFTPNSLFERKTNTNKHSVSKLLLNVDKHLNDDTCYHCNILNADYADRRTKIDDCPQIRTDKHMTITVLLLFIGVQFV